MRESVKSSNVDFMDYDEKKNLLTIGYKGGSVYEYSDVLPEHIETLRTGKSFGSQLYYLRKKYDYPFKKIV